MSVPTITVLGIPVAKLTVAEALAAAERSLAADQPAVLAYVNAHSLNLAARDEQYRTVLKRADLVLNDGSGLAIAAKVQGAEFPANLNGTDFTPKLLAALDGPVYFYGGRPGVAERATRNLVGQIPHLRVAGTAHGFLDATARGELPRRIKESGARILVVALGNPAQELWLAENLAATGAGLGVAVGAFLDFAAGEVRRAPDWMRRAGIEWVYRLWREPGRLWRRYVLGNPVFLFRVMRERMRSST